MGDRDNPLANKLHRRNRGFDSRDMLTVYSIVGCGKIDKGGTDMGDQGRKDKDKRDQQKKDKHSLKEKRQSKAKKKK